jgi:hypothetical protein
MKIKEALPAQVDLIISMISNLNRGRKRVAEASYKTR